MFFQPSLLFISEFLTIVRQVERYILNVITWYSTVPESGLGKTAKQRVRQGLCPNVIATW